MKNGRFSCIWESDFVCDVDGKLYNNKCMMCKVKLEREVERKNDDFYFNLNGIGLELGKDICDEFRN